MLVNDEEATLMELNKICGANHHLSSKNKIPKKRLPMETNEAKGIVEQAQGVEARDKTRKQYLILVQDQKIFYISWRAGFL